MAAGAHGRARIGRSIVGVPRWLPVAAILVLAVSSLLVGGLHPWAPLIICGALGLGAAVVTGAPRDEESRED